MMNVTLADGKTYRVPVDNYKQLMIQGTGRFLTCDPEDWNIAKHCTWHMIDGKVKNRAGTSFEDYVKITGKRQKEAAQFDFRRKFYA